MDKIILFISHKEKQCGVHQFGYHIGKVISQSKRYQFIYRECSSESELNDLIDKYSPSSIIYNYYPSTMSWLTSKVTSKYNIPQVSIIHEVTQHIADNMDNTLFDFYIAPDPTLILKNPIIYKTGRLLQNFKHNTVTNEIPIIGSFGFSTPNKMFVELVKMVCKDFEKAIIRLNIPFAKFGDSDGVSAKKTILDCQKIISNNLGISLEYSHDFLDDNQLLMFLSSNSINAFCYSKDNDQRGISSVIDLALSVKVPIAVSSNSTMFRHIINTNPSIIISKENNIKDILLNGIKPIEKFYTEWSSENLIWDYERIVTDVISKFDIQKRKKILGKIKNLFLNKKNSYLNKWSYAVKDYKDNIIEFDKNAHFEVADISIEALKFNRILNDESRNLYSSTIQSLHRLIPKWLERKIERANIQQAFILDSVVRLINYDIHSNIISIGCFEDTAWGSLLKLGYNAYGIDPVLNYDLDSFLTKPSTKLGTYDIVFSTSVIEHVEDDLSFLKNMCLLAKIGGYIILTCDFKEGYKNGDPKPVVDYRFYTKEYILNNLLSKVDDCKLVDKPDWDCPDPDFEYIELDKKYNYTFASIVLKKIK